MKLTPDEITTSNVLDDNNYVDQIMLIYQFNIILNKLNKQIKLIENIIK